ncbi:polyketide synthase [Lentzea sp. NBRC 105346]|uniref:3,5-dihydroxyphenylacetyl-CoA synthase DpgA n=1 Tax=Lentzea sp. NBRC 105346 TaxID=3032205 RepID=UPI0024A11858|nr:3,5-dihydroxyphenylacetyl-CoA synthase DpgA [Lentzea sp. NBRC 105346]GLZ27828.1 polyketide synthase [Lentzea sp. NBRC 105346]
MTALLGVGTATPPDSYTQREVLDLFGIDDPRIRSLFLNSAIERRNLVLPPLDADGRPCREAQGELLAKHQSWGVRLGSEAMKSFLDRDIGYLCCVSSTGFITPGFSALLIKELGLSTGTQRLDVVGMGCNAGLNALNAVSGWAAANPGRVALLVCIEVCSAAYVIDGTMRTSVVDSLFGDGAAALAVQAGGDGPEVLKFASCLIPEAIGAMRYDWDSGHGAFSFHLDRDVPYVVGAHAEQAIDGLLMGTGLRRSDIAHWVVHPGGKKVIDAMKINLGLTVHDLRHTTGVLHDHGNLSSGSFLFSYQRLLAEDVARPGDHGVLVTMGPGSTIETALVRW